MYIYIYIIYKYIYICILYTVYMFIYSLHMHIDSHITNQEERKMKRTPTFSIEFELYSKQKIPGRSSDGIVNYEINEIPTLSYGGILPMDP